MFFLSQKRQRKRIWYKQQQRKLWANDRLASSSRPWRV